MSSPRADEFLGQLRHAQAAFNTRDFETAFAGVATDVVWEFGDWVIDGGVVHGRDNVMRSFAGFGDGIEWTVKARDVEELTAGQMLVTQVGVAVGRTTDIATPMEFFSIFELGSDGLVTRVREFETREEALAAANA